MNQVATQSTALATQDDQPSSALSPASHFDLSPRTLQEAMHFSEVLADSSIVPKDFMGKPGNVLVAIQWGMELGLKPMQAMQNIAVINGRPSLWGDAVLALVLASPLCEYIQEWEEGGTAFCKVKRRGKPEDIQRFGDAEAKQAGLLGKSGPWSQYPQRMKKMRARSFAIRDNFADILKGIPIAEEIGDYQHDAVPRHQATPAQIAASAAPKADRTDEHAAMVDKLELVAATKGTKAFKKAWNDLSEEDRVAIGIPQRDELLAVGRRTDEHATKHQDNNPQPAEGEQS